MAVAEITCRSIVERGYFVDFGRDQDKQIQAQGSDQANYTRADAVPIFGNLASSFKLSKFSAGAPDRRWPELISRIFDSPALLLSGLFRRHSGRKLIYELKQHF